MQISYAQVISKMMELAVPFDSWDAQSVAAIKVLFHPQAS
jgi:hypothetical protein